MPWQRNRRWPAMLALAGGLQLAAAPAGSGNIMDLEEMAAPSGPALHHEEDDSSLTMAIELGEAGKAFFDSMDNALEEWVKPYLQWHEGLTAGSSPEIVAAAADPDKAQAGPQITSRPEPGRNLVALGETVLPARLDEMRGGFTTPDGMQFYFSFEQIVRINGQLVTTTALTLGNDSGQLIGSASSFVGNQSVNGLSPILVQNGRGNLMVSPGSGMADVGGSGIATVIQNSLDNQNIEAMKVINVRINSLELMRAMNLSARVSEAVSNALRR